MRALLGVLALPPPFAHFEMRWGGAIPWAIQGSPAVPFKVSADFRHEIPEHHHLVTDRAAYDGALRGRLPVRVSEGATATWGG